MLIFAAISNKHIAIANPKTIKNMDQTAKNSILNFLVLLEKQLKENPKLDAIGLLGDFLSVISTVNYQVFKEIIAALEIHDNDDLDTSEDSLAYTIKTISNMEPPKTLKQKLSEINRESLTEIELSILEDLEQMDALKSDFCQDTSTLIHCITEDVREDPDAYDYTEDDMETFMVSYLQ